MFQPISAYPELELIVVLVIIPLIFNALCVVIIKYVVLGVRLISQEE